MNAGTAVICCLAIADAFKAAPRSVGVDLLLVDGEDWGDFNADSSARAWPDAPLGPQYFARHPPSPDYQPLYGAVRYDRRG